MGLRNTTGGAEKGISGLDETWKCSFGTSRGISETRRSCAWPLWVSETPLDVTREYIRICYIGLMHGFHYPWVLVCVWSENGPPVDMNVQLCIMDL